MMRLSQTSQMEIAVSCGTLILNNKNQVLLCHVTGTAHWDLPKGMREPDESTLDAAKRELREETGIEFDDALFEEIGGFDYQKDKRLHLYKVRAPASLERLGHLVCTSHFSHPATGAPTPEMDGFRWASREDIGSLCIFPMTRRLLSLNW